MISLLFKLISGDWAGVAKDAEWIGAIFAGLSWALGHPSTAMWVLGATLILAVFRKGWPFAGVPNIDSFLGKAIVTTGLVLTVGGFGWRAADEVFGSHVKSTRQGSSTHAPTSSAAPAVPSTEFTPNGG